MDICHDLLKQQTKVKKSTTESKEALRNLRCLVKHKLYNS